MIIGARIQAGERLISEDGEFTVGRGGELKAGRVRVLLMTSNDRRLAGAAAKPKTSDSAVERENPKS
jgi:hypothetical protein